jgi:hypothetical protein
MKDITKQTFKYCLAESQGRGCLCAAMFHLKCGDEGNLILNFKADDTSYGNKTRNAWLVGYPGTHEMGGFYLLHKKTFEFLEKNFPKEDWFAHYYDWDDATMTCKMHDVSNRSMPDQSTSEFWQMEFEITKKMWDAGYINGNYPHGHYMMSGNQLVLAVSYFAAERGRLLSEQEMDSFVSCHKIQIDNKKKNWFIKNYVHNREVIRTLSTDDFWKLTVASQLGSNNIGFNTYLLSNLDMMGASQRDDVNEYISVCISGNIENYEIDYYEFNKTLNDQPLISS